MFFQVDVLSKVHHKNLVSLVGYCQEEKAQILLYEYMHNGSLFDHLHGDHSLALSGSPSTSSLCSALKVD